MNPVTNPDAGCPITVLLVDDQQLMRVGLRMVLDSQPDIEVVGEAGDGAEAVAAATRLHPAVVLMDVRMPQLDGVEATRRIVHAECAKVLVMTTFDLDEYALAALRAGASGFLLKDTPPEQLIAAVRSVASGDSVVSPSVTRRLLDRFIATAPHTEVDGSALDVLTERNVRYWARWRAGCPTPRSPAPCTCRRPPSRPTSARCWPSSTCATGCRRWCWPTRPDWSALGADPDSASSCRMRKLPTTG